jgi:hypothetical protein
LTKPTSSPSRPAIETELNVRDRLFNIVQDLAAVHGFAPSDQEARALVDEQLREGTLRRLDGPALAGFAYRLVNAPTAARRKSVTAFIDWLRAEAAAFRAPHELVMTRAA